MKTRLIKLSVSKNQFHKNILTESEWKKAHLIAKYDNLVFSQYVGRLIKHDIDIKGFLFEEV